MVRNESERPPDPTWAAFRERHPDSPFLGDDPLHALAEDVIEAIRAAVPGFFTADEEQFELDPARISGGGFFLRQPIGLPTSPLYRPGLTIEGHLNLLPPPPAS